MGLQRLHQEDGVPREAGLLGRGLQVPLDLLRAATARIRWAGRRFECPCCGGRFRALREFRGRPDALCPRCGSLERQRFLCLLVKREPELLSDGALLHLAPEPAVEAVLRGLGGVRYLSADVEPGRAMEAADVMDLPYDDSSFDVVVCSHVLEHVPDDRAALAEIRRVLKPGGRALLQHPVEPTRDRTRSDPSLSSEERLRAFGQEDHVRAYGQDFDERLRDAGFEFTLRRDSDLVDEREVERYRLRLRWGGEWVGCDIYEARRPT